MKLERNLTAVAFVLCFLPYPAVNLGGNSGVQLGHVAALLCLLLAFFTVRIDKAALACYAVVTLPYVFGAVAGTFMESAQSSSFLWKSQPIFLLSVLGIYVGYRLVAFGPQLLARAIAAVLAVHAFVGLAQVVAFPQEVFPFEFIFINNSFFLHHLFERPMCLFPEPSVYAAVISPLVLILLGMVLGNIQWTRKEKRIFWVLIAVHSYLLLASKSGASVVFIAAAFSIVLRYSMKGIASFFWGLAALLVFVGAFFYLGDSILERFDRELNGVSSWASRFNSIKYGVEIYFEHWKTIIFGFGPNQSQLVVNRFYTELDYGQSESMNAIISMSITYLVETGILGFAAAFLFFKKVISNIRRSDESLLLALLALVFIIDVSFVLSYYSIPGVWCTCGLLLGWRPVMGLSEIPPQARPQVSVPGKDKGELCRPVPPRRPRLLQSPRS